MTFLPLFWLAFSGLPRRLHDFPLMYLGWQSVATVGHLTTMIGVFCFYTALFESTLEKKLTVYLYNLIPRLYSDYSFFSLKLSNNIVNYTQFSMFPFKKSRTVISKNILYM